MTVQRQMLTPREAARMLGISYPTIKKWILDGRLKTRKTPGGHHRIALTSLKPYLERDAAKPKAESRERYRHISGRNQFPGKVVSVRFAGLMAEVVLAIGELQITSIITAEAAKELRLRKGDSAAALIKATNVMIEHLDSSKR